MVMNKSPRCFYQFGKIITGGGGPRTEKRGVKKKKKAVEKEKSIAITIITRIIKE